MKDLEIRGAGNLLGVEQSGSIAAVGFSYYCQLLAEAVEEIKAKRAGKVVAKKTQEPAASVDIKLTAYIGQDYIENTRTRFNIYQRLAKCGKLDDLRDIENELKDRFGEIPEETANLLYLVKIKILASLSGIETVSNDGDQIILAFQESAMPDTRFAVSQMKKGLIFGARQIRIDLDKAGETWQELMAQLLENIIAYRKRDGNFRLVFYTLFLQVVDEVLYRNQTVRLILGYFQICCRGLLKLSSIVVKNSARSSGSMLRSSIKDAEGCMEEASTSNSSTNIFLILSNVLANLSPRFHYTMCQIYLSIHLSHCF